MFIDRETLIFITNTGRPKPQGHGSTNAALFNFP